MKSSWLLGLLASRLRCQTPSVTRKGELVLSASDEIGISKLVVVVVVVVVVLVRLFVISVPMSRVPSEHGVTSILFPLS